MDSGQEYRYKITVQQDGTLAFQNLVEGAEKLKQTVPGVNQATSEIEDGFKRLSETIMATVGVYAAWNFGKESLSAFTDERNELVKLNQVYKDNSQNTTMSIRQLEELAEKQEELTGIHKEDSEQVEAVMMSHKNLKISYEQLLPVINDFAKFTGQDSVGAANLFTRALANPAQAMRILRTANIDLTFAEKNHLEQIAEVGNGAKAQGMIFDLLKDKYAGVAEAMYANDPEAQIKETMHQASIALGQLEDELVKDFMPAVKDVIEDLKSWIAWGEKHKGMIEATIKVLGVLVLGFTAYKIAMKAVTEAQILFNIAQKAGNLLMGEGAAAAEAETVATEGLAGGLTAALGPLALLAGAVGVLYEAYNVLSGDADKAALAIKEQANQAEHAKRINEQLATVNAMYGKSYDPTTKTFGDAPTPTNEQFAIDQYGGIKEATTGTKADLAAQYKKLHSDKNKDDKPFILAAIEGDKKLLEGLAQYAKEDKEFRKEFGDYDKKDNSGTSQLDTPSPTDAKAEHQIINTWQIGTLGKIDIHTSIIEEAKEKFGEMFQDLLMSIINNAQIASGQ